MTLLLLLGTNRAAQAACGGTTGVSNAGQLTAAIDAFNGETGTGTGSPCVLTIQLDTNIALTASPPTIDNTASGIKLFIQGNDNTLYRQNTAPNFRPITIAEDTVVEIDQLTIIGGNVTGYGGGIQTSGILTITNSTIFSNSASLSGGGIFVNNVGGSQATVIDSTISDNSAGAGGGGIFNFASLVTVTNSTISDNTAKKGAGIRNYRVAEMTVISSTLSNNAATVDGGGFANDFDAHVTVTDTTLVENRATINGGGFANDGAATIIDSTVMSNTSASTSSPDGGGGLYNTAQMTVTNSTISDNSANYLGGGIFNSGSNAQMTVTNSTISDNSASHNGGGIFNYDYSEMTVTTSTISGNSANSRGGGILNASSAQTTVTNSTISDNSASEDGGGIWNSGSNAQMTVTDSTIFDNSTSQDGGGIWNSNSARMTVTNSTISDNSASQDGGGIYNQDYAEMTVTNSTISGNSARGTSGGGGIWNYNRAQMTVTNSTISGNSARISGSGIYNSIYAQMTVTNSTISDNSATRDGGGIYNWSNAQMTVTNSTISDNSVTRDGGGIWNYYYSKMTVTNSTISGNRARNSGGGIYNRYYGNLTLRNTIVANSTYGGDCVNAAPFSASHTLIEDGAAACGLPNGANGNIIGQDPLLGPLADNGGPTLTHALLSGSLALDTGNDALAVDTNDVFLTTDQRGAGFPRLLGPMVDMGAVEGVVDYTLSVVAAKPGILPGETVDLIARVEPAVAGVTIDFSPAISLSVPSTPTNAAGMTQVILTAGAISETVVITGTIDGTSISGSAVVYIAEDVASNVQEQAASDPHTTGVLATHGVTMTSHGTGTRRQGVAQFSGNPCPNSSMGVLPVGPFVDVLLENPTDVSSVDLTVAYTSDINEANHKIYWCDLNGNWALFTGAITVDTGNNTITFTLNATTTPSLSQLNGTPFVANNPVPLAVSLGYFLATRDGDQVDIVWQTATETGTAGFNLFAEVDGTRVQLNNELIPSTVIDSVEPVNYSARYASDAEHFYLEEIEVTGARSLHGPFSLGTPVGVAVDVSGEEMRAVYLPLVSR